MLTIKCPWCGEREQIEFTAGGEAHIARPENTADLSDEEWGAYIYTRTNPKGVHYERWVHSHGCGKWFNAVRHTVTDIFWDVYKIGAEKPAVPGDWDGTTTRAQYQATQEKTATPDGNEK